MFTDKQFSILESMNTAKNTANRTLDAQAQEGARVEESAEMFEQINGMNTAVNVCNHALDGQARTEREYDQARKVAARQLQFTPEESGQLKLAV